MGIFSVIPCAEEHGTAQEDWNLEDWEASVTLRCAWSLRHNLVSDLLGNRRPWPFSGFAVRPLAKTARIRPVPSAFVAVGQTIDAYIHALVDVTYSAIEDTDLIAESLEPTAEFITLDFNRFRWGAANGDPLLEEEAPGKLRRGLVLNRTLFHVNTPLPITLLTLIGTVNNAPFVSGLLGLTFNTETLLYTPPTMSRTITTAGATAWNMTLKFMFQPETWNFFWRAKTQSYQSIFLAGGGQYKSYPPADFSDFLF